MEELTDEIMKRTRLSYIELNNMHIFKIKTNQSVDWECEDKWVEVKKF